ncbi:MAG: glutaminyl-peptide cyclotransferase, partial [Bacteroidetes bacterium]|nr:glutaminyl-peptide cyclotransferase [Bacteroidota bacterium]
MSFVVKIISFFVFSIFFAFSCKQDPGKYSSESDDVLPGSEYKSLTISSPIENSSFKAGDEIGINFSFKDSLKSADSVVYKINGRRVGLQTSPFKRFVWDTKDNLPGIKNLTVTAYYSDSTIENRHIKLILLSDIQPQIFKYQVVSTFPHDKAAYTQGLVFEDGFFYEGTGQIGQSTLRKIKPETGERLKVLNLPPDVFGEGIAIVGDFIYQLTYQSNVAFQYDKHTFELVNKFTYPMQEGWGLTYDGKNLLMTDGSNNIYYLDPDYFTEVKRIEVYDDKRQVDGLNELEYINGEIWANVYTTDTIVVIQPMTGKVTG